MKILPKKDEGMESENIADFRSRGDIEAPPTCNNFGAANGNGLNFLSLSLPLNISFAILETTIDQYDKMMMIIYNKKWKTRSRNGLLLQIRRK